MTSSDAIPLWKRVTIVGLVFSLGVLAAFIAARFQLMGEDPDDRPPIIVSNGSVRVEEADQPGPGSRPGKLSKSGTTSSGRPKWRHKHPGPGIKRMEVLVSGVNSSGSTNCGVQSEFYARKVESIEITYSLPSSAASRTVDVKTAGSEVEIDVDQAATATQTAGKDYAVDFDGPGVNLQKVILTLPGGAPSPACVFGAVNSEGTPIPPRITILQRQK